MTDLELRKPEDGDIVNILGMFAENDPARAGLFTPRYYEWQFRDIPGGAESLVGAINGEVVAFGALLPFKASIDGETDTVYEGAEFVVRPRFRDRGIFTRLAKSLYELVGNSYTFAFASPLSYRIYQWKLDHAFFGYFPYWAGVPNVQMLLRDRLGSCLGSLLEPLDRFFEMRPLAVDEGMPVETLKSFDSRWNVVTSWNRNNRFCLLKDADYLNWRYVYHPHHGYDLFGCFKEDQPMGYLVLRGQNLLDVTYATIAALKSLLNAGLNYFRSKIVLMAHTYLSLDPEGLALFQKMGFWRCNAMQGRFSKNLFYPIQRTMVKSPCQASQFPAIPSWIFSMGDLDGKL